MCALVGLDGSGFVRVLEFILLWVLLGSFCNFFWVLFSKFRVYRFLWVLFVCFFFVGRLWSFLCILPVLGSFAFLINISFL